MANADLERDFVVLAIRRWDLIELGLMYTEVQNLSDTDMQTLAQRLKEKYETFDFQETAKFIASTILAEKEQPTEGGTK